MTPMVIALLRERADLVSRGLGDRVGQVDEQLAFYGHDVERDGAEVPSMTAPRVLNGARTVLVSYRADGTREVVEG